MEAIDIFIAYSEADKDLLDRLRKQLSTAERIGLVDAWHDGEIEIGTDREQATKEAMEHAEIIVLLLSADFFASERLYEQEMTRALELAKTNNANVIPVLLKDCTWQLSPLSKFQILPKNAIPVTDKHWSHPDRAFKHVVDEIIRISNQIRKKQGAPTIAYRPTLPKKEGVVIQKTVSVPTQKAAPKTSLSKIILYALLGLGAFALISFFINRALDVPSPQDPIGQEEPVGQDEHDAPQEPIAQQEPPVQQQSAPREEPPVRVEQTTSLPRVAEETPSKTTAAVNFQTIKINQLEWSAQNMDTETENSWCYKDQASNCSKAGRLYNFDSARKLCPNGWRLPKKEEWLALSTDDISKLGLHKGGVYDRGSYRQLDQIGYYFTAERSGGGEAWVIEYRGNERALVKDRRYTHWGMSCRCVR